MANTDSVTMDAGGALVTKCIINLLCFRKRPDILAITAVSLSPIPTGPLHSPGQQACVSCSLQLIMLMRRLHAWHERNNNRNRSASEDRFTRPISFFKRAVQIWSEGLHSPEENVCRAEMKPKAILLIADLKGRTGVGIRLALQCCLLYACAI